MKMIIRPGKLTDIETIVEFNAALAYETEAKNLDLDILTLGVKSVFERPERGIYYLAEVGKEMVGQLLITLEWSDWRNAYFWWIQSVYVRPDWRRKGVFQKLYQHVASLAKQQGNVCGLRLYVDQKNTTAQQTYRQLGMSLTSYSLFEQEFRDNA